MNAHIQVKHRLPAWEAFRSATDIAPISDAEIHRRMIQRHNLFWTTVAYRA